MAWIYEHVFHLHNWRSVPTADVNTTFALSLSVLVLMIYFAIAVKGLGGWIHELFCAPFGSNPFCCGRPTSCSISSSTSPSRCRTRCGCSATCTRARSSSCCCGCGRRTGLTGTIFASVLGLGWAIFHILIVVLQAFIFMMLTVGLHRDGVTKATKTNAAPSTITHEKEGTTHGKRATSRHDSGLHRHRHRADDRPGRSRRLHRRGHHVQPLPGGRGAPARDDPGAAGQGVPAARPDRRLVHHRRGPRHAVRLRQSAARA